MLVLVKVDMLKHRNMESVLRWKPMWNWTHPHIAQLVRQAWPNRQHLRDPLFLILSRFSVKTKILSLVLCSVPCWHPLNQRNVSQNITTYCTAACRKTPENRLYQHRWAQKRKYTSWLHTIKRRKGRKEWRKRRRLSNSGTQIISNP